MPDVQITPPSVHALAGHVLQNAEIARRRRAARRSARGTRRPAPAWPRPPRRRSAPALPPATRAARPSHQRHRLGAGDLRVAVDQGQIAVPIGHVQGPGRSSHGRTVGVKEQSQVVSDSGCGSLNQPARLSSAFSPVIGTSGVSTVSGAWPSMPRRTSIRPTAPCVWPWCAVNRAITLGLPGTGRGNITTLGRIVALP